MLVVAHRTPSTAAGCAEFAAAGARFFEVDVQLAGDTVVVSHYLPFLRLPHWFEHDNWRFRWRSGPPHDMSLRDAVDIVPADCRLLLDPKETDPRRRARLAEELDRVLPGRERFCVSTDVLEDLARYRAAGFDTWRTIKNKGDLHRVLGAGRLPDQGVSVRHTLLTRTSVAGLHRVADTVVAWTVNDVARARQLHDLGVDGITTDRIEVMSAAAE
jgi:glycerophosphoryl diester phosphodiesterase